MSVTFVKTLMDTVEQNMILVRKGNDDYFVVSSLAAAFDTRRPETLVFPATHKGEVTSYGEVASSYNPDREQAITEAIAGLERMES